MCRPAGAPGTGRLSGRTDTRKIMAAYKEFQGRTLDEAIQEACEYYDVPREKLEIDIVNDAKSGIFGLVGVKKATIRAARVQPAGAILADDAAKDEAPKKPAARGGAKNTAPKAASAASQPVPQAPPSPPVQDAQDGDKKTARDPKKQERASQQETPAPARPQVRAADRPPMNLDPPQEKKQPHAQSREQAPEGGQPSHDTQAECPGEARNGQHHDDTRIQAPRNAEGRRPRQPRNAVPKTAPAHNGDDNDAHNDEREEMAELALDLHSGELVCETVCAVITRLISPIVGEVSCTAAVANGRVRVTVDCGEASGILVGREGQTLAAIQYLAARVVAKELGGALRLQIDVGNYRERQDERLKELALQLAEKAKATKRAQSTRPLSAYQRRIIHLALEGDEDLQTHSKGEGIQRRVVIQLRRSGRQDSASSTAPATDDPASGQDDPGAPSHEDNAED